MIAVAILLLSLGLDTFAIVLGLGLSGLPRIHWRRVGLTFSCFEGLMPVASLLLGRQLSSALGAGAGYAAASLLILIGILAIKEARSDKDEEDDASEHNLSSLEGRQLLLTGLSVSLDELAVGFSLTLRRRPLRSQYRITTGKPCAVEPAAVCPADRMPSAASAALEKRYRLPIRPCPAGTNAAKWPTAQGLPVVSYGEVVACVR